MKRRHLKQEAWSSDVTVFKWNMETEILIGNSKKKVFSGTFKERYLH